MIKRLLAAVAIAAFTLTALVAQVPSFGPVPFSWRTYHGSATWTPAVTASKDILSIAGNATTLVRVTRLECDGVSTADGGTVVAINKYVTTATTGGTATTVTGQKSDSADAAPVSTLKLYTAAPTTGTGGGAIRTRILNTVKADGSEATATALIEDFTTRPSERLGIVLRGTTQALALTVGGAALPSGTVLNCSVEWTEL